MSSQGNVGCKTFFIIVDFLSNIEDYVYPSTAQQLVDLRSLSHFQHGSIPQAISCPLIFNPSAKKASHSGTTVFENFPAFIEQVDQQTSQNTQLVFFCKDGQAKSRLLAPLLKERWDNCKFLSGGYEGFVGLQAQLFSKAHQFVIIHGKTGSGKTAVLEALEALGEQVLHLERTAKHRGSVFGRMGSDPQPTSPQLANQLMLDLLHHDRSKITFVENKGKYIGRCAIPPQLLQSFAQAPGILLAQSKAERINNLLETYRLSDEKSAAKALQKLAPRLDAQALQRCQRALIEKDRKQLVELLLTYYDQTINYQAKNVLHQLQIDGQQPMEIAQQIRQLTYPIE